MEIEEGEMLEASTQYPEEVGEKGRSEDPALKMQRPQVRNEWVCSFAKEVRDHGIEMRTIGVKLEES